MNSAPRLATAKAIHDLRADRRSGRGWNVVPNPPASLTACTNACSAWAGAITVVMPDHVAMRAAASFEAIPPLPTPERLTPARSTSSVSKAVTSSINVAVGSSRGSAVKRPAVSVKSTRCDAPTRFATSAARRSLSPKRISSSATASFSFTIGTTWSACSASSVPRACRY